MNYSFTRKELAQPTDVTHSRIRPRPRTRTRPVSSPASASATEGTTESLRRFGNGELESVTIGNRYTIRRVLGQGGMATVYEAYDRVLARVVALKVLDDVHTGDPRLLARFLSEARMTARLNNPHIVEALDFGTTRSGIVYLTMELLQGEDLRRKLVREGALGWERTRDFLLDICAGLEAAHAAGIVHRDLKPSNCFCVAEGDQERVRIVDFGIATATHGDNGSSTGQRLTLAGHIVGTPEYMSPEQVRGETVDHRSDIYSLAMILGEMLTGRLPYDAKSRTAVLAAHLYEPVPSLRDLAPEGMELPAGLEALYTRALSKNPADRFPNIQSFAAALREVGTAAAEPSLGDKVVSLFGSLTSKPRWAAHAAAVALSFVVGVGGALGFTAHASSTEEAETAPAISAQAEHALETDATKTDTHDHAQHARR